jgi:glucosamine--fructose-6-phosphate aminotransferase (isomerizing)
MPKDRHPDICFLAKPEMGKRPMMLQEIHETPERIEALIDREAKALHKALAPLRQNHPPLILVAGRGTSHHAASYGQYLFEHFLGIPVSGAALSLFTLYPAPVHLKGALAIGLSQSGESPDVVKTLRTARRRGAYTIAVTNTNKSSLSDMAHHTVHLHARKEYAVAATKTYTAQLVALLLICRALGGDLPEAEIASLPDALRAALKCEDAIVELAPYYRYAPRCLCLARGFNSATARETALKLMETCYLGSSGMSAADFLHGPIAFVDHATPILLFAPNGPTYRFMQDLAKRLNRQEIDFLTFTNRQDILRISTMGVSCPADVREGLSPIPFATLGQLFACHLALVRGLNPDAPRRLRKVTRTL